MINLNSINEILAERDISWVDWLAVMISGVRNFNSTLPLITLSDPLEIGKYAGQTVENICKADPAFMKWLLSQPTSAWFTKDVIDLVDKLHEVNK